MITCALVEMFELNLRNLSLIAIVISLIYKWYKRNSNYFVERNVKSPKSMPIFGFMGEVMFKKRHSKEIFMEYYNKFADERYEL
jgi:hypothetical protein